MFSKKSNWFFWVYFIPPSVWLCFFFLAPLFLLWLYSFGTTDQQYQINITWTIKHYIRAFEPLYLFLLAKSIFLAALTTVISLLLGFFIALFIAFSKPSWKAFWLIMIILPFWTNLLIRVFGLVSLMSNGGIINKLLEYCYDKIKIFQDIVGWQLLTSEYFVPFDFMYNYAAVVIGMVYVSLPFMVLPIFGSLDKLDISYLEASLDLGATHFYTIRKVMIPMIMPGIRTGIFLTFIPSISSFLIPEMLGGPNAEMIANVIQRQFGSGSDWPFGASLAFLLMYITFFALIIRSYFSPRIKD